MAIDIRQDKNYNQIISGSRVREFFELDTLLSQGHAIVYGEPGIGKTAFLEAYKRLNTKGYERIGYRRGFDLERDDSSLTKFYFPRPMTRHNDPPDLLMIDGFDEIRSSSVKDRIYHMMSEGRSAGYRVILSSRTQVNEKIFERIARPMFLRGLNEIDIKSILDLYSLNKDPKLLLSIGGMLAPLNGNPGEIIATLNFLTSQTDTDAPLIYQNKIVIEEIEKPTLILPEAPKIITDIRTVNKRILDKIDRSPQAIFQLSPREFEIMVAELFEERGYKVELTKQTRDGGKDMIILDHRELGNLLIYAECKRNAPDRPVGVSVVSDLYGRMAMDRATAGIVITSSYFSPEAKSYQSKFEHQMTLIDFIKLSEMIKSKNNNSSGH